VRLLPTGELAIEGEFAEPPGGSLAGDPEAAAFVRDLQLAPDRRHVRYRFALREAAEKLMDVDTAIAAGDAWMAPPSTWLLHPEEGPGLFRFHVVAEPPAAFVAGTHPEANGAPDTYEAPATTLDQTSFAAFGSVVTRSLVEGRSHLLVAVAPHDLKLAPDEAFDWVFRAVHAIANYAGVFPAPRTLVIVMAGKPGSPTRGETLGEGGPAVLVRAGDGVTGTTVRDDWVMTHELLHVALPSLPREQVWLGEGLPSYVEPIVRVRAGLATPERLWLDLVKGLPQGLPAKGDEGLDRTHTWGRTYWGGSLFCLAADVRIREETDNARSLDDVVRAVVASGADVESHWEVERLLDAGDRATGTHVLRTLYGELALAPGTVDLALLWRRLGVGIDGDQVTFDDRAPLARVRRGIAGR
jgi:hypothetical protein